MTAREIIASGLLELYCLGEATEADCVMIETLMKRDAFLLNEYKLLQYAIEQDAGANAKQPRSGLLQNIFDSIAQSESEKLNLPPLLSPQTIANDWWNYLTNRNIRKPENNAVVNMIEFVQTPALVTYIAWAKKGAIVDESHDDQIERLFMLQGSCKIEIDGSTHYYSEGDFVEIPAGTLHRAEATSNELMILIGQRVAA